jgi:hypothetical protein
MYFGNRYAQFLATVIPLLQAAAVDGRFNKLADAIEFVNDESKVSPGILNATDATPMQQARQYVDYIYFNGPKPRFVELAEM